MWALWWVWLAGAFVLAILEMTAPGFVLLGFAIGAAVVGILLALGVVAPTATLPWLLVVFAVISLLAWIALRRIFALRRGQHKIWDRDINED